MMPSIKKLIIATLVLFSTYAYAQQSLQFKFIGINKEMQNNAQSRLTILKDSYGKTLTSEEVNEIMAHAASNISQALQPYGYFKTTVKSQLTHEGSNWTATFFIKLGPPIRIKRIDLKLIGQGQHNIELKKQIYQFNLKPGQIFKTVEYEKSKEQFFQAANNAGYIKASIQENKVLIDLKTNQATIVLHFKTGPLFYFGPVKFEGNQYAPSFLYRFVPFSQNENFSSQKLLALQQSLSTSYYFQQIDVTPDFNHVENYHVPIHITMTPPKSQRYNFGIGYGTFTGPRFTAGASLRRLTNTGQHADAQLKLSSVSSGIIAKYYIPGKHPLTDQWVFSANTQRFLPKNGQSNSLTFSGGYERKFGKLKTTTNLNYLTELYTVYHETRRNSHLFFPNFNLYYVNANELVNPDYGYSISFSVRGSSDRLLSTTNFLQSEVKGKYIFSPTDLSRIILRGDIGYTVVNDLNDLPLSMRFFAGGSSTVRGYAETDAGSGRYLQVGSLEFQHRIKGNWSGAVFYDIGSAANQFNSHYKNGTGVGVVYESMIGPIKVYVAHGKKYGIEFSIGPEF